jgi:hypothetical protein
MTHTINAGAGTMRNYWIMKYAFSGGNINTAWTQLKAEIGVPPGATVDDTNHSISAVALDSSDSISNSDLVNYQINQNHNNKKHNEY